MTKLAKLHVRNDFSDKELKQVVEELFLQPVDEWFILPNYVARAKQFLNGLTTCVGSFLDYPLGFGTTEKVAFEAVDLFQKGAEKLVLPFFFQSEKEESYQRLKELASVLQPLVLGRGDWILLLKNPDFFENEWSELIQKLREFRVQHVAFEVENVARDMQVVRNFGEVAAESMRFSVYMNSEDVIQPSAFFDLGVSCVGQVFQ